MYVAVGLGKMRHVSVQTSVALRRGSGTAEFARQLPAAALAAPGDLVDAH